jgi:alkanesulfonate monooxygenase SsuD/methylene tetrahydromethanopterin reductase-like flavin-dependent oxidoreductase (luciferase family)
VCWDLDSPELFDEVSRDLPAERVAEIVNISADPGQHAAWLHEYAELGFDRIFLHHVGQQQDGFVDAFGAKVLPQLAS